MADPTYRGQIDCGNAVNQALPLAPTVCPCSSTIPLQNITNITPILKTVDRSEPANYKPVALTNHMTKILERVLRREAEELLNKTQHGFRNSHSTITQLLT